MSTSPPGLGSNHAAESQATNSQAMDKQSPLDSTKLTNKHGGSSFVIVDDFSDLQSKLDNNQGIKIPLSYSRLSRRLTNFNPTIAELLALETEWVCGRFPGFAFVTSKGFPTASSNHKAWILLLAEMEYRLRPRLSYLKSIVLHNSFYRHFQTKADSSSCRLMTSSWWQLNLNRAVSKAQRCGEVAAEEMNFGAVLLIHGANSLARLSGLKSDSTLIMLVNYLVGVFISF